MTAVSPNNMPALLMLIGRALLVALFAINGLEKITALSMFSGYIGSKGIPFPSVAAGLAAALEIGASLILLLGWQTRWTALVLAVYTMFLAFALPDTLPVASS